MGGAEGSPFVDFLFRMFCTESFHLEVHPAGLSTENLSCPSRTSRPASEPVSPESTRERFRADGPVLTLPVSSGPG